MIWILHEQLGMLLDIKQLQAIKARPSEYSLGGQRVGLVLNERKVGAQVHKWPAAPGQAGSGAQGILLKVHLLDGNKTSKGKPHHLKNLRLVTHSKGLTDTITLLCFFAFGCPDIFWSKGKIHVEILPLEKLGF